MTKRLPFILIGVFVLLLGLAQILVLPPFEGIDEFGHYSMIRQFAAQGLVMNPDKMFIDQAYDAYQKRGPTFYSILGDYDQNGGYTYRSFFDNPERAVPYRDLYRERAFTDAYKESAMLNWQQQHPPLYYLMMAGVQKSIADLSFVDQFFTLRFASFLLAWAGFMIGLAGSLRYAQENMRRPILASFALYPLFFLQFTPEFARVGNDSLCLFLIGIFWALFLRAQAKGYDWRGSLALGVTLGAGLMTKGLFIPVAGGYAIYGLTRVWADRHDAAKRSQRIDDLVFVGLPVLICGFWYVYKALSTGAFLGHHEYNLAVEQGKGLIQSVLAKNTGDDILRAFFGIFTTWTWSGTFSQPRVNEFLHYPYLFFVFWVCARGYLAMGGKKLTDPVWLVQWIMLCFFIGIFHHALVVLSFDHNAGTPGWYLHIMAPPIAYFLSFGLAQAMHSRTAKFLLGLCSGYTFFFFAFVQWQHLALFSGCAHEEAHKHVSYADQAYCLTRIHDVFENVSVLAWPVAAVVAFVAAWLCFACCLLLLRHERLQPGLAKGPHG